MSTKFDRIKNFFRARVVQPEEVGQEIIIIVIGKAGSGKTTFINTATGDSKLDVGHSLKCKTGVVSGVRCNYRGLENDSKVVFVDTPALDHDPPLDVAKTVKQWLNKTFTRRTKADGILYLHPISDNRLIDPPSHHVDIFSDLCGESWPMKVSLTTTMWQTAVNRVTLEDREQKLRERWSWAIKQGAKMDRFDDKNDVNSAWRSVDKIIGRS